MTATITGLEEMKRNMESMAKKYGQEVAKATVAGGYKVRATAIKSIQAKSAGEEVTRYRLGGNAYSHTASKEGDAPNTDTGALARSVAVEIRPDGVFVGSSVKYAAWLEFGTSRMAERPWLNPALERNRRDIQKAIAAAIKKVKP
jgi:HK97 gp10 family phage protein